MIFTGTVAFYDDEVNDDVTEDFFVCAETFMEASKKIVAWYGEDAVQTLTISIFGPEDFLLFPKKLSNLFNVVKERVGEDVVWY